MDSFCPLVEGSTDPAHERLTLGVILLAFLPALVHLLNDRRASVAHNQWAVGGVIEPMRWPTGARCWRPFKASRMTLFSWTARCRRWTATRRPKPFANGKTVRIHNYW